MWPRLFARRIASHEPSCPVREPFDAAHMLGSGFRALLKILPIAPDAVFLDIGIGGSTGANTTDHIVELFDGPVIGVEADPKKAQRAASKFGERVETVTGFYGRIGVARPFDVVVFDLLPFQLIYEELLGFCAADGLRRGGYAICGTFLDMSAAYAKGPPFFPEDRAADTAFFTRYFGQESPNIRQVEAVFERDRHFEFVSLCPKWFGDPALGWLVLRRRTSGHG